MRKQIIFEADINSIIFKDSKSENDFYSMTEDELIKKMEITRKYGSNESNSTKESSVPDEYTIKVSPFLRVESKDDFTEIYRPSKSELIDFQINKIEWMFIRIKQG